MKKNIYENTAVIQVKNSGNNISGPSLEIIVTNHVCT